MRWYEDDLIDIFVVSRPDFRVTKLVTPLKPFEAMRGELDEGLNGFGF